MEEDEYKFTLRDAKAIGRHMAEVEARLGAIAVTNFMSMILLILICLAAAWGLK